LLVLLDLTLVALKAEWDSTIPLSLGENLRAYALEQLLAVIKARETLFKHFIEIHGFEMMLDIMNFPKISNHVLIIVLDIVRGALRHSYCEQELYKVGMMEVITKISKYATNLDVRSSALGILDVLARDIAAFKKVAKKANLGVTAQQMLEVVGSKTADLESKGKSIRILLEMMNETNVREYVIQQLHNNGMTKEAIQQLVPVTKKELLASEERYLFLLSLTRLTSLVKYGMDI
jgi:hypothetical protein